MITMITAEWPDCSAVWAPMIVNSAKPSASAMSNEIRGGFRKPT
jgi:hypothetical protein